MVPSFPLHISLVRAPHRRLLRWYARAKTSRSRLITAFSLSLCSRLVGPTASLSLSPLSPFPSSVLIMADKEGGRRRQPHSRSLSPINSADGRSVHSGMEIANLLADGLTDHHSAAARHASHTLAPYPGSKEKFSCYSIGMFYIKSFFIVSGGFYGFSTGDIPQKC